MDQGETENHYELVVIGSGPAGEKAAVKAAYFGHKAAVVEMEPVPGGAGSNTGTLPSKTLKESALYYSGKYDKGLYGADRDLERKTSIEDFMFRKAIVVKEADAEVAANLQRHGVALFPGKAHFADSHRIVVETPDIDPVELHADNVIIATGSYPFHPANVPFDGKRIHDSDSILQISRLPRSLCVVGAGVIGCEYATIFSAMGTKVYLVNNAQHILGFLDHEISAELVTQMAADGIEILFGASLAGVEPPPHDDGDVAVRLEDGRELSVDMFLFAAGRSGRTRDLNCEAAGVALGPRETVVVNDRFQTNVPHIYAVGDVIGFPALASTSMDQGRVAISHMFEIDDFDSLPKIFPYGIYTIPEVSMVGMTEEEAKEAGIDYFVGRAHHAKMARGAIMGSKAGVLKLIIRKADSVIIGVHILGQQASELIHYGLTLVKDRKSLMEVISTVFNYPTLHELYKYACFDALGNLSGRKLKET
jgi:NAD(P) transhydrogenase